MALDASDEQRARRSSEGRAGCASETLFRALYFRVEDRAGGARRPTGRGTVSERSVVRIGGIFQFNPHANSIESHAALDYILIIVFVRKMNYQLIGNC